MTSEAVRRATKVFVVFNPVAGRTDSATVRQTLEQALQAGGQAYDVYETTGSDEEDIGAVVRSALPKGYDLVVAVGGDGTVSATANALVGSAVPLAIVPAGTANVLVREIGVPVTIEAACALLASEFATVQVDAMRVGEQHFLLQIGVGLGSLMIRDTSREAKGRFGRAAYLWTMFRRLVGFQPQRFMLVIDGVRHRLSASEVLLANGGVLGVDPLRWGPDIHPDDGQIDVCVVWAKTLADYSGLLWHAILGQQRRSRGLRYYKASKTISVNAKKPLPVQADGEIIGTTPLQVQVVPHAVQIAVPFVQPVSEPTGGDGGTTTDHPAEAFIGETAKAEAAPAEAALKEQLREIKTPEQARVVADKLLATSGKVTEQQVAQTRDPNTSPAQVADAAAGPGAAPAADAVIEAAAQIAAKSGEQREALEHAVQRATSPEQYADLDPDLIRPLELLRNEILERMAPFQAIDTRLYLAINHLPHTPLSNWAMYSLTTVMNAGWGWLIGLGLNTLRNPRKHWPILQAVAPPLWLATVIVEYPIKHYFRRTRPFIDVVKAISVGRKPGTYSFPSGHSAAAFAGAWLITRHYPKQAPLWYAIAGLVGFSRVYLGAHYPGDVVSGAVSGTLLAEGSRRALEWLEEEILRGSKTLGV
jgi:YegS/Rv2252/BmrU family lipid kinase